MEKEDFLETCLVLCGLDKASIIKTILKEKFKYAAEHPNEDTRMPSGLDLLLHNPGPEGFAEYAFGLCALEETKESITRHLLSVQFDAAVQAASRPRVRTRSRQSLPLNLPPRKKNRVHNVSDTDETESEPDVPVTDIKLPSKLHLFLKQDGEMKTVLNTISDILTHFFPGVVVVWPGIYGDPVRTFVLLVADNGRYKNSWRSSGTQNQLTWFTSSEDADRAVLDKILDPESLVHVIRKRNGEMRYMGSCQKVENVDREEGSCVMHVA